MVPPARQPVRKSLGGRAPVAPPAPAPQGNSKGAANRRPAGSLWGPPATSNSHVKELTDMGFSEEAAKQALAAHAWDVNRALDGLLAAGALCPCPDAGASIAGEQKKATPVSPASSDGRRRQFSDVDEPEPEAATRGAYAVAAKVLEADRDRLAARSPVGAGPPSGRLQDVSAGAFRAVPTPVRERGAAEVVASQPTVPEGGAAEAQPAADALTSQAEVTATSQAEAATSTPAAPRKQLARLRQCCQLGTDANALQLEEGAVVLKWADSATPHGWVFAELPAGGGAGREGWLPVHALSDELAGYVLATAVQAYAATGERQLELAAGDRLAVNPSSKTALGWIHAELAEACGAHGQTAAEARALPARTRAGWVPEYCLQLPVL